MRSAIFIGITLLASLAALRYLVCLKAVAGRTTYRLRFPRDLTAEAALAFVRAMSGLLPPWWRRFTTAPHVVFEVLATAGETSHRLTVSAKQDAYVLSELRAAIPGIRIEPEDAAAPVVTLAGHLRQTSRLRPLRTAAPEGSAAAILAALQPLAEGEEARYQWVIAPALARPPKERERAWFRHATGRVLTHEERRAVREKLAEPAFAVTGRLAARASATRSRVLLARLSAPLHVMNVAGAALKRRAFGGWVLARRVERALPPIFSYPLLLNARELLALLGLPLSSPVLPGLELGGCRQLPAAPAIPSQGRVLAVSNFPGAERPLAVSREASLASVLVIGPSGVGKSTVEVNLGAADARSGGLALLDPKGDTANDFLDRIPPERERDVIVFDPTDTERPVPLSLLTGAEHERELIARNFVGVMQRIWAAFWGPRTADILSSAVLTLGRVPGMTPCEIPLLLTSDRFRAAVTAQVEDFALQGFWHWYESLSAGERASAIGPVMNKLRAFTLWPTLRTCLGMAEPTFTFDQVLAEGKILVVRLPKGALSEEGTGLLGSLIFARLWSAVQARAILAQSERPPFYCLIDELVDFVNLPTPLEDVVSQARGLGCGLVLATQFLGQMPPATRQAILNCRTKVAFSCGAADAAVLAKEFAPHLTAADLLGLGPREVALSINLGDRIAPPATGRTLPMTPSLGSAQRVRHLSRMRYGRDRAEVEAAIRERQSAYGTDSPIGGKRRRR
ncbi:MAG TPA: hypothetical protein VGB83_10580 [Actinomycetota bacterium]